MISVLDCANLEAQSIVSIIVYAHITYTLTNLDKVFSGPAGRKLFSGSIMKS